MYEVETNKPAAADYPISLREMRERYLQLYSGAVNDVLRFKYGRHSSCFPSDYHPLRAQMKLAGPAFTVKGAPDITPDSEMEMRAKMLESLHEPCIVVWDCTGDRLTAQWGEVMTIAAVKAGCGGAVVNGVRDAAAVLDQEFAVFHKYHSSCGMLGRFRMYHYQKPVLIGEIIVRPGDWVLGDIDGLLSVPEELAYEVLVCAEEIVRNEDKIRRWVKDGVRPSEVVARGGYF